jgi:hypothetical protein
MRTLFDGTCLHPVAERPGLENIEVATRLRSLWVGMVGKVQPARRFAAVDHLFRAAAAAEVRWKARHIEQGWTPVSPRSGWAARMRCSASLAASAVR